jgi:hypothetical protein
VERQVLWPVSTKNKEASKLRGGCSLADFLGKDMGVRMKI